MRGDWRLSADTQQRLVTLGESLRGRTETSTGEPRGAGALLCWGDCLAGANRFSPGLISSSHASPAPVAPPAQRDWSTR